MAIHRFFILFLLVPVIVTGISGCGNKQKQTAEKLAEKIRIPKEDLNKFVKITDKQRDEIKKYVADYGVPPEDLNQLKEAGYTVYDPYPHYKWYYMKYGDQFDIRQEPSF